jgi:hypothetical protein
MAIKGKGKARSRRPVTGGPKPVYVVPRRPLFARRGVQLVTLGVVLGAIGAALLYGFLRQRSDDRLDREAAAVQQFKSQVEQPLSSVSESLPPLGVRVFAELRTNLDQLEQGDVDPSQVIQRSVALEETATSAADAIAAVEAGRQVREGDLPLVLLDSQDFIVQAVRTYKEAARTLRFAAEAEPGDERDELISITKGLLDSADVLFKRGYDKITSEMTRLGIFEPAGFGGS